MNTNSVDLIIKQIKDDVQKEIDSLLQRAKRNAGLRIKLAQGEAKRQRKEHVEAVKQQAKDVQQQILATVSLETRKIILKAKEDIINNVLTKVRKKGTDYRSQADYKKWLQDIIVSGIKQLGEREIVIAIDQADDELINQDFIVTLKKKLDNETNVKVEIDNNLKDTGAIIKSGDGRKILDNRFSVRMEKKIPQLRLLIAKEIFGEDSDA